MAEDGFKIADAFVDVHTDYDERETVGAAQEIGEVAGDSFEDRFNDTIKRRTERRRDERGRFIGDHEPETTGRRTGNRFATTFLRTAGRTVQSLGKALFTDKFTSQIGGGLMSFVKSPAGLAAIATAAGTLGTLLASGIASTLSVALAGGFGLGIIGLGAWLLRSDKGIQRAAKTLGDHASKVFQRAAKPMARPFVIALGAIDRMLTRLTPTINRIFAALAPAIEPLTRGMVGFIEALAPSLERLSRVGAEFLIALADKLPGAGAAIGRFLDKLVANWPEIQRGFFMFMGDVGSVVSVLAKTFVWLASNYESIRNFTVRLLAAFNPMIVIGFRLYQAFVWLRDGLPGWLSTAGAALGGFLSMIGGWVGAVVGWFTALPGRIWNGIKAIPGLVLKAFQMAASSTLYAVGYFIGATLKFFIDLPGRIRTALSTLWAMMQGAWTTARTNVISFARSAADNAVAFFRALPGRAAAAVSGLWRAMVGAFNSAVSGARNGGARLASGFLEYVSSLPARARAQAARVQGAIVGVFSGAGNWLRSAGRRIMDGLYAGLGDGIGKVKGLLNSVTGWIPDWKGPPEKDAKLLRPNGRLILQGLQRGIAEEVPALRRQLGGITAGVPVAAAAGVPGATGGAALGGGGLTIGQLVLNLQGVIDPKDPLAARKFVAWLYAMLKQYERDYA